MITYYTLESLRRHVESQCALVDAFERLSLYRFLETINNDLTSGNEYTVAMTIDLVNRFVVADALLTNEHITDAERGILDFAYDRALHDLDNMLYEHFGFNYEDNHYFESAIRTDYDSVIQCSKYTDECVRG